ncbi:MAG TPA: glycosyltransferase family 2 protein [Patescibacteria group bacterium]|nr:glycosyltransferase family 2 protein [Patescibacteria group bacterium]
MKIDVVIPNYNGAELIRKNLPRVIAGLSEYLGKIIVVDDCSDMLDYETLKNTIEEYGSKITLLRNDKNLGFSSTVNIGVKTASTTYVVLLNSDVSPSKNFLKKPIEDLAQNSNLFGVGFMDESIEGEKTVKRGRGIASWNRGFLIHRRGEVDKSDTFWISGGSSIVNREKFTKLKGFDSIYNPFYWEDIDLSYRARKAGFDLMFESESVVEHRHEEGAIKKHYSKFRVNSIAFRNQFIFVWKNISNSGLIVSHIVWLPYHIVKAILRADLAFFWGFFLALLKIPNILKKRAQQNKQNKIGDQEILR